MVSGMVRKPQTLAHLKHAHVTVAVDLITRRVPDADLGQVAHELAALLEELEGVLAEVQFLRNGQGGFRWE